MYYKRIAEKAEGREECSNCQEWSCMPTETLGRCGQKYTSPDHAHLSLLAGVTCHNDHCLSYVAKTVVH